MVLVRLFYTIKYLICKNEVARELLIILYVVWICTASPIGNSSPELNTVPNNGNIAAQTFTFRELAAATKNFRPDCLIGEGGFGRVYRGTLEKSGQVWKKQSLFLFFTMK